MAAVSVSLGEQLRDLREERGLSLRAAACDSGLSWQALGRIERGERSPGKTALEAIARAFGVSFVIDQEGTRLLARTAD